MKPIVFALVAFFALPAFATDTIITVTMDEMLAMTGKSGEKLEKAMFVMGEYKGANEPDHSDASSSAFGKDKKEACKWALMSSLLKFQANAKGRNAKVVNVHTVAGATDTAAPTLSCLAGKVVVRSRVTAGYAKK